MKVKFVPQNVEFEIAPGQSVLHVAQDNGIYIKSVCKGVPSCAECRVRVTEGDHNVLPPASEELSLIGTGHFIDHRRLSCQLKCFGDITVDMNEQLAKEQGILVGRKKKLAVKDDRVEQAVARRSEEPGETEGEVEEGDATGEVRPHREARAREPRDNRQSRDNRPQRDSRPPREGRPPRDQQRSPEQGGPQQQPPQQARGPRPPQGPPRGDRPQGAPGGAPQAQGQGQNPNQNPNGPKKRRRRRGKGGGGGGGGSGGPTGDPSSRPGSGPQGNPT